LAHNQGERHEVLENDMKRLTLTQQQIEENKYQYRVLQVVNYTKPKIGTVLSEAEAQRYCASAHWTVTIKAAV